MNRKVYLMSLINSCPLNHPSRSCPLKRFRDISILKLIKKTNSLSEEKIILLINKHKACYASRMMAIENKELKKESHV